MYIYADLLYRRLKSEVINPTVKKSLVKTTMLMMSAAIVPDIRAE